MFELLLDIFSQEYIDARISIQLRYVWEFVLGSLVKIENVNVIITWTSVVPSVVIVDFYPLPI